MSIINVWQVAGCCGAGHISVGERNPAAVKKFTQDLKDQNRNLGLLLWCAKQVPEELEKEYLENGWVEWGTWAGQYKGSNYAYLGGENGYNMKLYALVLKTPLTPEQLKGKK